MPIKNTDNICMARAIAVCYAHVLPAPEHWGSIRERYPRKVTNVEIAMLEGVMTKKTRGHMTEQGYSDQDT